MAIQQTTVIPEVKKTIIRLRHLSADEKVRQEANDREKWMHDKGNAFIGSRREGFQAGLAERRSQSKAGAYRKRRAKGMTDEEIRDLPGEE